ncbi:MAG: hypothetical protein OYH77_02650 [Pseudomonadota bacterium]|nr:hypothetical protein [Pseudomonadota bacterium]
MNGMNLVIAVAFTFGSMGILSAKSLPGDNRTVGKRYSKTLDKYLQQRQLQFAVPWQRQFVDQMLERIDELPFNKIAENPATMQKMTRAGTRLLSNRALIDTFAKAEGLDFVSLMARIAGIISDAEKLRFIKDSQEIQKTRERLFANANKLLHDQALQRAARKALIEHGAFLAQVIKEEGLITGTLGQKEFLAELNKYEEGILISKIIHIPTALKTLETAVVRSLSDKQLLAKLFDPKTVVSVSNLAMNTQELLRQVSTADRSVSVDSLNLMTLQVMNGVVENGELLGMILDAVNVLPEDIDPTILRNKCQRHGFADRDVRLEDYFAQK